MNIINLRIIIALGLGVAILWASAPYATSYISSQAVVNAPLNTVLSPMQGRIIQRSPPAGTGVHSGTALVAIEVKERDRRYLEELRARRALLGESLASIAVERSKLKEMEQVMSTRISNYREQMLARMAAEMREAEAALAAAEAGRVNAATTIQRAETLVQRGYATVMRVDADSAANIEAAAGVSRLRARLERIRIELTAVEAGIFVQDGWNDVPYSQQRLDGIVLRLAALTTEARRAAGERAAVDGQTTIEEELVSNLEIFNPTAPSAGVIWKESGGVGETVVPGDVLVQIIDCGARFVEVTLPERYFGDIEPGDTAWVRLKGGGKAVSARVSAVLGAGAKFDHPRLAASVAEAKPDQLRVLVSLQGAGIDGQPSTFCHVGRTAEVRFERRDLGVLSEIARAVQGQLPALFRSPDLTASVIAAAPAPQPGL